MTKTCKQCLETFENKKRGANNVKFCTLFCREEYSRANRPTDYKAKYDIVNRAKHSKFAPGKFRCPFCSGWYKALMHHVWQRHNMSASEYKERFGLNRSHTFLTPELKERKREAVFENGTVENLKKGALTRFMKGDTRPTMKYKRREETLLMLRKRNFKKQS